MNLLPESKRCMRDGCDAPRHARQLCSPHYAAHMREHGAETRLDPPDGDDQDAAPAPVDDWRTRAACRGADPDLFFPDRGGHVVAPEAKAICNGCEVRQQCLDYAIATRQEHGIWGGTSLMERRQIRRARREQVSA